MSQLYQCCGPGGRQAATKADKMASMERIVVHMPAAYSSHALVVQVSHVQKINVESRIEYFPRFLSLKVAGVRSLTNEWILATMHSC